jgi:hypothetical protein
MATRSEKEARRRRRMSKRSDGAGSAGGQRWRGPKLFGSVRLVDILAPVLIYIALLVANHYASFTLLRDAN